MGLDYEIFGDRYLIEEEEVEIEEKSEGGIFIPNEVLEKEKRRKHVVLGRVKAAGPDASLAKTGEDILYHVSDTIPLFLAGREYKLIKEEKVIGKKK